MKIIKILAVIILTCMTFGFFACATTVKEPITPVAETSIEPMVTNDPATTIGCSSETSPATDEWQTIPSTPTESLSSTLTEIFEPTGYFELSIVDNKVKTYPIENYPKVVQKGTYGGWESVMQAFIKDGFVEDITDDLISLIDNKEIFAEQTDEDKWAIVTVISNADTDNLFELALIKPDYTFYLAKTTVEIWHNEEFLGTISLNEKDIRTFYYKRYGV